MNDENYSQKVLLIGSSMTYYNRMPEMLQEIARNQGHYIYCKGAANGGTCLADNAEKENVIDAISNACWDVVVLQESISRVETRFEEGLEKLDGMISKTSPNTKYVFYEALRNREYYIGDNSILPNVTNIMTDYAKKYDAAFAPMGEAFCDLLNNHNKDYYCKKDDLHPLPQASFLAALCIYYAIYPDEKIIDLNISNQQFYSDLLVNLKKWVSDEENLPDHYELDELQLINEKAFEYVNAFRTNI